MEFLKLGKSMCIYFSTGFYWIPPVYECCMRCPGGDPIGPWSELGVLKECQETQTDLHWGVHDRHPCSAAGIQAYISMGNTSPCSSVTSLCPNPKVDHLPSCFLKSCLLWACMVSLFLGFPSTSWVFSFLSCFWNFPFICSLTICIYHRPHLSSGIHFSGLI